MGKAKADKAGSSLPPSIAPATNPQPSQSSPPATSPNPLSQSPILSQTPLSAASLTSKQWIVPPRPKPGRKPATDTPPTKRKAQNRAAQRAFRERRAARVGELEEELKKIEKEDEEEQIVLRAQIETQEKDIDELKTSVSFWMQRCRGLESELAVESAAKEQVLQSLKDVSSALVTSPVPEVPPLQHESMEHEHMGCGNCSSINNCSCIQEVINMSNPDPDYDGADFSGAKRAHSPSSRPSNSKRAKPDTSNELETDFTGTFSRSQVRNENGPHSASPSGVPDPCGFCTDGTACICAEMQAEAEANAVNNQHHDYHQQVPASRPPSSNQARSRISELSHITPPPSDTDVSIYLPPIKTTPPSNSCINGPGTCLQCRSDPQSTLFCKSLARSRERNQAQQSSSTCCGGNANGGPCCQSVPNSSSQSSSRRNNPSRQDPDNITIPPLTLTCADAFTTLSRHPGYERAMGTNEMSRWLPKLHPHLVPSRPTPPGGPSSLSSSLPSPSSAGAGPLTNTIHDFRTHNPQRQRLSSSARRGIDSHSHSHGHGYDTSGEDIGVQVPVPGHTRAPLKTMEGRPAMEIDAANVMAVLREFDRRFAD